MPNSKVDSLQRRMHRVTPNFSISGKMLQTPGDFVVLEAFDGCDNLSQRGFWGWGDLLGDEGVGGIVVLAPQEQWVR